MFTLSSALAADQSTGAVSCRDSVSKAEARRKPPLRNLVHTHPPTSSIVRRPPCCTCGEQKLSTTDLRRALSSIGLRSANTIYERKDLEEAALLAGLTVTPDGYIAREAPSDSAKARGRAAGGETFPEPLLVSVVGVTYRVLRIVCKERSTVPDAALCDALGRYAPLYRTTVVEWFCSRVLCVINRTS